MYKKYFKEVVTKKRPDFLDLTNLQFKGKVESISPPFVNVFNIENEKTYQVEVYSGSLEKDLQKTLRVGTSVNVYARGNLKNNFLSIGFFERNGKWYY